MVESIQELREICQNSPEARKLIEENSRFSKIYTRKVSIYLTKALLYTSITADQVTLLFALIGIVGALLFAFGFYWYSIVGALLLQVMYLVDHSDGEVARYRGTVSLNGLFLELMCHKFVTSLIFVLLGFGVYRNLRDIRFFLLGVSAALSLLLLQSGVLLRDSLLYETKVFEKVGDSKKSNKIRNMYSHFSVIFKVSGISNVILIGAVLNLLPFVLIFYGITFPVLCLIGIYRTYKYGFD